MRAGSSLAKNDCILVVDDSPDNVLLVQTILEEEGYDIITADNGMKALKIVEQARPDLVLLDVMMPGMDGYEVTKRIRENRKIPFIPILLITAYDQSSLVRGLDIGADDFIRKPVELDELLARVRCLLRLKHTVDERDQMVKQREDFVSRLTHDLRTPLVAAAQMLNLIQQGALGQITSECSEALHTMARSNQNLLKMVNTLLEVYRYEAGRKNLNFFPVDLSELVKEVVQELTPLAKSKSLSLELNPREDPNPPNTTVMGDRLELQRLITNLIGNAIQYTDQGAITVSLDNKTDFSKGNGNQSLNWVKLCVQDTGIGIPAEEQIKLFERFRQGNHTRAGSGLGLHLSRQIVEVHQGTIDVNSEQGKGSTFTICLPAASV
ncbi:response regulator [Ancylothrix sp. C2]|uniref:sensor histidine kinase n=1 Tax=Ancylothrix sp. D3o TaxID=2953691 RepID=UPI0021BA9540|nr:response regulator [Ancylothrix sp. D3o]MCT7948671.1 response regulator [Ancylothrix sp. D3o]